MEKNFLVFTGGRAIIRNHVFVKNKIIFFCGVGGGFFPCFHKGKRAIIRQFRVIGFLYFYKNVCLLFYCKALNCVAVRCCSCFLCCFSSFLFQIFWLNTQNKLAHFIVRRRKYKPCQIVSYVFIPPSLRHPFELFNCFQNKIFCFDIH